MGRLSINRATAEQLQLRLCSERFKYWQSDYTKLQYPKNSRQKRKEQQRRLLLDFDEAAFEEYGRQESLKLWSDPDRFKLRDGEIALGLQVAVSDAMVTWRQEPNGITTWSAHSSLQAEVAAASASEKSEMVDRVQPYLQSLTSLLKKENKNEIEVRKSGRDRRWMSFEQYTQAPTKSSDATTKRIECVRVEQEPKLCVSTLESSYHVEPAIISEYLLRDFHPVAAPKPVDYVIVCPSLRRSGSRPSRSPTSRASAACTRSATWAIWPQSIWVRCKGTTTQVWTRPTVCCWLTALRAWPTRLPTSARPGSS